MIDIEKDLSKQLDVLDQIQLKLKHDKQYRLPIDLFKKLAEIRVGSFPANIHPVFHVYQQMTI